MIFDRTQTDLAAWGATVHALADAQPSLTPAESAFMRLYLLRERVPAAPKENDR